MPCILKNTEEALKAGNPDTLSFVRFGTTQFPSLWDYADGVDTVEFLLGLA